MDNPNCLTTLAKRLRPLLKLGFGGGGAGGGGHIIEDEGAPLANRTNLNFVGAGVTVTDDDPNHASVVTIPGGGGGGNCDRWVDAYASFDGSGTPYDKEEDGCYLQYGNILHACAYWRVPAGCSGEIYICPVFILAPGTYGGVLRCSTDMYRGFCGGVLSYYDYIQGSKQVAPSGTEKTILCIPSLSSIVIAEEEIIKLVIRVYTIDDDPDPFEEDCWFLGWDIRY